MERKGDLPEVGVSEVEWGEQLMPPPESQVERVSRVEVEADGAGDHFLGLALLSGQLTRSKRSHCNRLMLSRRHSLRIARLHDRVRGRVHLAKNRMPPRAHRGRKDCAHRASRLQTNQHSSVPHFTISL
ncbi:hypothetical protein CEXT_397681 [Caerostris extrusa]|uniref:Uncharacterized protein n=1 Tax=Caerostris extrusa TaxID=172846 RepID=A0AAV4XT87_CAEEX|nr:hypothetical protein CEXT_397681 [Caerostris extrusa]